MKLNTFFLSTLSVAFILQGSSCFSLVEIEGEDQVSARHPHYQAMVNAEAAPVIKELTGAMNFAIRQLNEQMEFCNVALSLSYTAEDSRRDWLERSGKNDSEKLAAALATLEADYTARRKKIADEQSAIQAQAQQILTNYTSQENDTYFHARKNVVARLLAQSASAAATSE